MHGGAEGGGEVSDFGNPRFVVVKITFSTTFFPAVEFGRGRRYGVAELPVAACGISAQLVICVLSIDTVAVNWRVTRGGSTPPKCNEMLMAAIFFESVTERIDWARSVPGDGVHLANRTRMHSMLVAGLPRTPAAAPPAASTGTRAARTKTIPPSAICCGGAAAATCFAAKPPF